MSSRILRAEVSPMPKTILDPMPTVSVDFEDGTSSVLFSYFPDEIQFTAAEFIGLTRAEAMALYGTKDREYLRT
jgi:hypothetical protein